MINRAIACLPIALFIFSLFSLSFSSMPLGNAEHLEPISEDRILIDGLSSDWRHLPQHSAEYLLKGSPPGMDDFKGGLRFAYNSRWLYIALECLDSDFTYGQTGDQVTFTLDGEGRSDRLSVNYYFKQNRQSKSGGVQQYVQLVTQVKSTPLVTIEAKHSVSSKGYFIESRIPMNQVPWLYGSEANLSAIFTDIDEDGENSTYTTHLTEQQGSEDKMSYVFGGAQIYKEIYIQQTHYSKKIAEISHDWVGDQRMELLLITDAEIVVFGEDVTKEGGIIRYIHGWRQPERVQASIKGQGKESTLVVKHLTPQGREPLIERFRLKNGVLKLLK
jgi:hypothetical protein